MAVDISVVLTIILLNYKEALVYFFLAAIAGILVFSSCLLGRYLSDRLNPPPPHHSLSGHQSRAHSIRSLHSHPRGEQWGHQTMTYCGPGPPNRLGSWTRPTTLGSKSTMCSPWTVSNTGSLASGLDFEKQQMLQQGPQKVRLSRRDSNETEASYPWLWYSHQQQGGRLQVQMQPEIQQGVRNTNSNPTDV